MLWLAALLFFAAIRRSRQVRLFCIAGLCGMGWGTATLMWDARQVAVTPGWLETPQAFTAEVSRVEQHPAYARLLLNHVRRKDGEVLAGTALLYAYGRQPADMQAGRAIRATARWRLPRNRNNPGAFDYQSYCFDRQISLIGSLRGRLETVGMQASWLESLRQRIRQALAGLPDAQAGILSALLLADKSRVPTRVWEAFAAGGAAHLLAISGLHAGLVAAFAGLLCWWFLGRREDWIVRLPVRGLSLLAGAAAAMAYATLAGWPLPAQRAVMMLAAAAAAWWRRDHAEPVNTLLAALMFILLVDAGAVASVSLWLSFAATGALLLWAGHIPHAEGHPFRRWLAGLLWVSLLAMLATLPLIMQVFERLPVYSLITNTLLVPVYSLIVLPAALLGEVLALAGLTDAAAVLFGWVGSVVDWANGMLIAIHDDWPGGNLWLPALPRWLWILYAAGMLVAGWLLLRRRHALAFACAVAVLAVYMPMAVSERPPARPEFVAWDVGQGASASLLLPDGWVMVVDAPGAKDSRFNGGTIAAAGLRALGLAHVDVLVVSHAQADHMGGAMRLMDHTRSTGEVWLADVPHNHAHAGVREIVARMLRRGGAVRWLKAGDRVRFGSLDVQILWPPQGYDSANHNDTSLVLSLRLPDGTGLLLPGDIQAKAEQRLVEAGLQAHDVALVPHHGSRTSSTPAWVSAVVPQLAIVQSGRFNRYGFPAPEVVSRYKAEGAQVWNTAAGAVVLGMYDPAETGRISISQFRTPVSGKRQRALQWWQRHL